MPSPQPSAIEQVRHQRPAPVAAAATASGRRQTKRHGGNCLARNGEPMARERKAKTVNTWRVNTVLSRRCVSERRPQDLANDWRRQPDAKAANGERDKWTAG